MRERVDIAYPFEQGTKARLDEIINQLVNHYATCVTKGSVSAGQKQLKLYQREQVRFLGLHLHFRIVRHNLWPK